MSELHQRSAAAAARELRIRRWLTLGIVGGDDDRARRSTCLVLLGVFGTMGIASSAVSRPDESFSATSLTGILLFVALLSIVLASSRVPRLWSLFVPLVACSYVCGIVQLGPSAFVLLPPACLGVFWAALFLPTRDVGIGALCVAGAVLAEFWAMGVSLSTSLAVVASLVTIGIGTVMIHGIVMTLREAHDELEHARRAAEQQAATDSLTGLPNRRSLRGAAAGHEGAALLLVDVDRFKEINDLFGHASGDTVLREIARRMAEVTGGATGGVQVVRWGGDEFAIIARGDHDDHAPETLAEVIRSVVVRRPVSNQGVVVAVSVSVGGTWWSPDEDLDAALERADEALYAAKGAGRNRVAVSDELGHVTLGWRAARAADEVIEVPADEMGALDTIPPAPVR
jgi:diguanylate cyclase (GGDEF)-like protein